MTRINCVPVQELSGPHLVAEYRELPRVYKLVYEAVLRGELPNDPRNPQHYRLGPGHVRFFYPRLRYVTDRLFELVAEMDRRGYAPQFREPPPVYDLIPGCWDGRWTPDAAALALNRARIAERTPAPRKEQPA